MVEHLVARVYAETAGSKQSQGGMGGLIHVSQNLEFHSGLYHLSYYDLSRILVHVCANKPCCVVMFLAES